MKHISIRPIQAVDNPRIAAIIRQVLTEYGLNRDGFAFVDTDLDRLFDEYKSPHGAYHVAEVDSQLMGGAGFGPLLGGEAGTAELKKMYLLPEARGLGLGQALMEGLLPLVRAAGYTQLYLETMPNMDGAIRLYEKFGFRALQGPLGNTGHHGCQAFYLLEME